MSDPTPPTPPHTAPDATPDAAVEAASRKSPSLLDAPATYLLLGINILVFALMIRFSPLPSLWHAHRFGSILTAPFDIEVLKYFGGSDAAAVLYGQWWRLLTATFVHANVLHLLVNMWCLWNLGLLGEPLLGRQGLIATYLLTGTAGNLLSLAFSVLSGQDALVVGASGAIFGIAGILIVLLSNKKLSLPWRELRALRSSVIQFAALNVLIGMAPQILLSIAPSAFHSMPVFLAPLTHIDNTAHIGGLFCGLALGLPLFPRMMSGRGSYRTRQRLTFAVTTLLLTLFAYSIYSFRSR